MTGINNHLKAHIDLANEDHRLDVRSLLTADGEGSILVTLPKAGFAALSAWDQEWIGGVSDPWSGKAEVEILIKRDRNAVLTVKSFLRFQVKADRLHDAGAPDQGAVSALGLSADSAWVGPASGTPARQ